MLNLLSNFIIPLILTVVIELFIAVLFGFKDKTSLMIIALINVITNPLLSYVIQLNYILNLINNTIWVVLFLEILVVFVEWGMLVYALNSKDYKNLFVLSLIMNLCSLGFGATIFGIN